MAVIAAVFVAGSVQAAFAGRAANALPRLLGAEAGGECIVGGTVQFPAGLPTDRPVNASVSVSGGCQGAFIGGNIVQVLFSTQATGIGSCVALEAPLSGSISFSSGQSGFTGTADLTGNLSNLQLTPVPTSNTAGGQFAGVVDLVVTTASATLDCVHNVLGTLNVTGVLLFGSA